LREGIFAIYYTGRLGSGLGLLVLKDGKITGADVAGGLYDGTYESADAESVLTGRLLLTVPAGTAMVTGALPQKTPVTLEMPLKLPGNFTHLEEPTRIDTAGGAVNVIFKKLRDF